MSVSIGISQADINRVIQNLRNAVTNEASKVLEEVGKSAEAEVGRRFAIADQCEQPIIVSRTPYKTQQTIYAKGLGVTFAEFGAGDDTDTLHPYNDGRLPFPIFPGSYSLTEGRGDYAFKGYWVHNGIRYTSISPTRGMFYGMEEAKRKLDEIKKGAK